MEFLPPRRLRAYVTASIFIQQTGQTMGVRADVSMYAEIHVYLLSLIHI